MKESVCSFSIWVVAPMALFSSRNSPCWLPVIKECVTNDHFLLVFSRPTQVGMSKRNTAPVFSLLIPLLPF